MDHAFFVIVSILDAARGVEMYEDRKAKLKALHAALDASIAAGGEASDAEIDDALEAKATQLAKEGF
jgi:antitoxin ParD1/3/4